MKQEYFVCPNCYKESRYTGSRFESNSKYTCFVCNSTFPEMACLQNIDIVVSIIHDRNMPHELCDIVKQYLFIGSAFKECKEVLSCELFYSSVDSRIYSELINTVPNGSEFGAISKLQRGDNNTIIIYSLSLKRFFKKQIKIAFIIPFGDRMCSSDEDPTAFINYVNRSVAYVSNEQGIESIMNFAYLMDNRKGVRRVRKLDLPISIVKSVVNEELFKDGMIESVLIANYCEWKVFQVEENTKCDCGRLYSPDFCRWLINGK